MREPEVDVVRQQPQRVVHQDARVLEGQVAMVARMLALAHHLQGAIDRDLVADRASVARSLGVTRARVTQLLDLLMLAPDIQEQVLAIEAVDGVEPIGERALRDVAHAGTWEAQGRVWMATGLGHTARDCAGQSPAKPETGADPR